MKCRAGWQPWWAGVLGAVLWFAAQPALAEREVRDEPRAERLESRERSERRERLQRLREARMREALRAEGMRPEDLHQLDSARREEMLRRVEEAQRERLRSLREEIRRMPAPPSGARGEPGEALRPPPAQEAGGLRPLSPEERRALRRELREAWRERER